ncbi:hypothetical protein ACET3Z_001859 [Daucus carota]
MKKFIFFTVLSLFLVLDSHHVRAAPKALLVKSLPGFVGSFPSNHYAGYVTLKGESELNFYYYFVTSEGNPSKDPVVLWLNGGPGCSSFDGFVYEHGPFNFEAGKGGLPTLHLNPYSWSKVSNIIYLDSPVGVGFSYSNDTSSYVTGDKKTAEDTHNFLLKWFEQYPEFVNNPFYIAGESYAGVYVPTLASNVVQGIKKGVKPVIQFQGYMVGNGVTDHQIDGNALVPFAHGMGLISDYMFEQAKTYCKDNFYDPSTRNCSKAIQNIDAAIDGLNIYDILEPCYHSPSNMDKAKDSSIPVSFQQLGQTSRPLTVRKRIYGRAWPFRAPVRDGLVPLWPQIMAESNAVGVPCINDAVATTWLNNDAVRKAIHASPKAGPWELCTGQIFYDHDAGSMIPYHKNLTSQGYRALIYSGDHDMCVPFTGSKAWTSSLGYKVVDGWRPWISKGQVAGYTEGYANNFTFLTVKGSGHTVPEYKPQEALDFYSRWLAGKRV